MIKSFMIISKYGAPLFIHTGEDAFDETLVSGYLSAIQNFAEEVNHSCIARMDMQNNIFFYAVKEPIYSVVVVDAADEVEGRIYQIIAERLGRAFLQKYKEKTVLEWNGNLEFFSGFNQEYKEITAEVTQMLKQSHREFISKYFVEAARNENILGMIVFDLEEDKILASDIPKTIPVESFESFSSMLFSFIDRLSKELKSGTINEILMRAEKYWIGGFRKGTIAVFIIFAQEFFGNILPNFFTSAIR
jgi:hypothetical protein